MVCSLLRVITRNVALYFKKVLSYVAGVVIILGYEFRKDSGRRQTKGSEINVIMVEIGDCPYLKPK